MAKDQKRILDYIHNALSHGIGQLFPKSGLNGILSSIGNLLPHFTGKNKEEEQKESTLHELFERVADKLEKLTDKLESLVAPKIKISPDNKFESEKTVIKDALGVEERATSPKEQAYGDVQSWTKKIDDVIRGKRDSGLKNMMDSLLKDTRGGSPKIDVSKKESVLDSLGRLIGGTGGGGGGGAATAGGAAGGAGGGGAAGGLGGLLSTGLIAGLVTESVKLHIDNYKKISAHLSGMGKEASAYFQSDRIEDVGTHALGAAKHGSSAFVRAIGGPILGGIAAEQMENNPMIKIAEAGFKMLGFLRQFSDHLIKTNLQFAEFSAAMAAVNAQVEIQQMFLSIQKGEARAEATSNLATSQFNMESHLAPFENAWSNIRSDVMTSFIDLFDNVFGDFISNVGDYLESMRTYMRKVAFWVDWDRKKREADELRNASRTSGEILGARAGQMFDWIRGGRRGPPPTFGP